MPLVLLYSNVCEIPCWYTVCLSVTTLLYGTCLLPALSVNSLSQHSGLHLGLSSLSAPGLSVTSSPKERSLVLVREIWEVCIRKLFTIENKPPNRYNLWVERLTLDPSFQGVHPSWWRRYGGTGPFVHMEAEKWNVGDIWDKMEERPTINSTLSASTASR